LIFFAVAWAATYIAKKIAGEPHDNTHLTIPYVKKVRKDFRETIAPFFGKAGDLPSEQKIHKGAKAVLPFTGNFAKYVGVMAVTSIIISSLTSIDCASAITQEVCGQIASNVDTFILVAKLPIGMWAIAYTVKEATAMRIYNRKRYDRLKKCER
jgi:hypothetical protein